MVWVRVRVVRVRVRVRVRVGVGVPMRCGSPPVSSVSRSTSAPCLGSQRTKGSRRASAMLSFS